MSARINARSLPEIRIERSVSRDRNDRSAGTEVEGSSAEESDPAWWREELVATFTAPMVRAAVAHSPAFLVSEGEVERKLRKAPVLVVAWRGVRPIGFVATTRRFVLDRTGLTARYVEGTIIDPSAAGQGLFGRMMDAAGTPADVELLHTQSLHMARAAGARGFASFPHASAAFSITSDLRSDLVAALARIDRPTTFDASTGLQASCYPHDLYDAPIAANARHRAFAAMGSCDGVLVASFCSAHAVPLGIERVIERVAA